jgi:hypothetical protein
MLPLEQRLFVHRLAGAFTDSSSPPLSQRPPCRAQIRPCHIASGSHLPSRQVTSCLEKPWVLLPLHSNGLFPNPVLCGKNHTDTSQPHAVTIRILQYKVKISPHSSPSGHRKCSFTYSDAVILWKLEVNFISLATLKSKPQSQMSNLI